MSFFKLLTLVLLTFTLNSYGQSFSPARLDSLFKALNANNQAMGSVCISHDGKVVYNKAFGRYADGKTMQAANTLTQYRIGSVTKMFTAVMVLQLVQQNRLSLKAPVTKYLPQLVNGGKITIDQLLSHTSGLPDFTSAGDYKIYAYTPQSRAQMLARIARFKLDFAPGQKTVYSNTNYLLLGYIIEQVTGKSYAANLQQIITDKISLQHTRYAADRGGNHPNEAQSYNYNGRAWLPIPNTDLSVAGGTGAILSTPADMVQFIRDLFKLKLINKTGLAAMTPISGNIGRGLVQVPVADQIGYGHFGIVDGFKSSLLYLPQSDLTVALCINSANTDDNAVLEQVLNITLQQLSRKVTLPNAQLVKYIGIYSSRQIRLPITLRAAGGYLLMQAGNNPILTLETISPTRFRFAKGDMTLDFSPMAGKLHFTLKQAASVYDYIKE